MVSMPTCKTKQELLAPKAKETTQAWTKWSQRQGAFHSATPSAREWWHRIWKPSSSSLEDPLLRQALPILSNLSEPQAFTCKMRTICANIQSAMMIKWDETINMWEILLFASLHAPPQVDPDKQVLSHNPSPNDVKDTTLGVWIHWRTTPSPCPYSVHTPEEGWNVTSK